MPIGKSTYILRFEGEKPKEMLVQFTTGETVRSNLTHIIPSAIRQGYLPESCSVNTVEIEYRGSIINLDLPLKEQGVKEHDVLILRDLSSSIRLSIRYRPDGAEPAMESIAVKPNDILRNALQGFAERVRSEHTFWGRKFKKYNLIHGKRKLNTSKSLRAQGIKSDIEVAFRPRVWLEWPPRFIWPPGPYTTYLIGVVVVAIIVSIIVFATRTPKPVRVTIRCKAETPCKICDAKGQLLGNNGYPFTIAAKDTASFFIYPREYPITSAKVIFKPGHGGKGKHATWMIVGGAVNAPPDSVGKHGETTFIFDAARVYDGVPLVTTTIQGWVYQDPSKRLGDVMEGTEIKAVINRFEYVTNKFTSHTLDLPRGRYEIRFGLNDNLFREVKMPCGDSAIMKRDFSFDLADSTCGQVSAILNFYYSVPR